MSQHRKQPARRRSGGDRRGHRAPSRFDGLRTLIFAGSLLTTVVIAAAAIFLSSRPTAVEAKAVGDKAVRSVASSSTLPTVAPSSGATATPRPTASSSTALPAGSGAGRRIVFDQSDQRVWLVDASGAVVRTYLVSGSKYDNLHPGTYAITSRTRKATSFDLTGTMEYFLRFTYGKSSPIGFHAIPVYNNGTPEQPVSELGTAQSSGCIRQKVSDAAYLWSWAPNGTKVVVVA